MTPKLKPCPFCGGEASVEGEGWHAGVHTITAVTCSNKECILGGPLPPEQWNRRTPDLTEALARLKALEERQKGYCDRYDPHAPHEFIGMIRAWADEIAAIRKALG